MNFYSSRSKILQRKQNAGGGPKPQVAGWVPPKLLFRSSSTLYISPWCEVKRNGQTSCIFHLELPLASGGTDGLPAPDALGLSGRSFCFCG